MQYAVASLAVILATAACGTEPNTIHLGGWTHTSSEVTGDTAPAYVFTGIPIDEAKANRVIHIMEALSGRNLVNTEIRFVAEPFDCQGIGLRDGCAYLQADGTSMIQIDMVHDVNRKPLPAGDVTCGLLAHELTHAMYGDGEHANPALWYEGQLKQVLTETLGCKL